MSESNNPSLGQSATKKKQPGVCSNNQLPKTRGTGNKAFPSQMPDNLCHGDICQVHWKPIRRTA